MPTRPSNIPPGTPWLTGPNFLPGGSQPFPTWIAPAGVSSRESVSATARPAAARQMTTAALDAVLPIPYGYVRLGALLANALVYNGDWVFWLLWGLGPLEAIDAYSMDNVALPGSATITSYLGTSTQTADATLVAAFAANGYPTYAETLHGIAYSVITIPLADVESPPVFNASFLGKKVYDPRLDSTNGGSGSQRLADPSTWTYTENPALMLADFLRDPDYGDNKTPVWSTVITAANACDYEIQTGEKRRKAGFVVDNEQTTGSWLEALRTAASCWLVPEGDNVRLVPDAAGSSVATYTHSGGKILGVSGERVRGASTLPTIVEIIWTDATNVPWRDRSTFYQPDTTLPYRKTTVRMPWILWPTQAYREAIERLNKLKLRSISLSLDLMDEGLVHEVGDIITLTYPDSGYSNLALRVTNVQPTADGWRLDCVKEDANVYSNDVSGGGS